MKFTCDTHVLVDVLRWPACPASSCRWQPHLRRPSSTGTALQHDDLATHVYDQCCVIGPEGPKRDGLVVRCVRRGIDIETLHVDVPPDMDLFGTVRAEADGARRAAQAMQIPVHSGLRQDQIERVARVVWGVLEHA